METQTGYTSALSQSAYRVGASNLWEPCRLGPRLEMQRFAKEEGPSCNRGRV